jgi:hypothetical protein
MPLRLNRPTGLSLPFMPASFVAPAAEPYPQVQNRFGSTVDRPLSLKIVAADGKNFTNVPAVPPGGVGAANARPQH